MKPLQKWPVPAANGEMLEVSSCAVTRVQKPRSVTPQLKPGFLLAEGCVALSIREGKKSHELLNLVAGQFQKQKTPSFALSIYLEYTIKEILALLCFSFCLLIVTVVTALECFTG